MIRELQFKFLTQRYADEIYRYAKGLLGDATEAEDAVQEVLIRFWQHLPEVQITKSRAWLYRTTRNHCIDLLRQRQAIHRPLYLDNDQLPDVPEEDPIDPSRQADLETIKKTVESAIQALPETLRSVFVLYEINGLRYREIATTLDVPINSVKVYLSRARLNLRQQLKEHESWINA